MKYPVNVTTTPIYTGAESMKQNFINEVIHPFKERFNTSSTSVEAISIKDARYGGGPRGGSLMCLPDHIVIAIRDMGYKCINRAFWEAPELNAINMGEHGSLYMGDLEFVYVFVKGFENCEQIAGDIDLYNEIEKQFNRPCKLLWMR